jgi:hypothetical protein
MPITFSCACGKILRVADEHAGRRVKCPACNSVRSAPTADPSAEPDPVFEVVETPQAQPTARAAPSATTPREADEEYDGTVYGLARPGSGRHDDDDDGPRDKPLPDFRLGSGQRGQKRRKN